MKTHIPLPSAATTLKSPGAGPRFAGAVVGVLAAIAWITSLSFPVRHALAVPRSWIDNYIISLPDTSFAWAAFLTLLAVALRARKRIAWWLATIYLSLFALGNALYFIPALANSYQLNAQGRASLIIGVVIDVLALTFLLITYRQFYTRARRGSVRLALAVLAGGWAAATLLGWGLVEAFPGKLTDGSRWIYAANRVILFASVDNRAFDGKSSHYFIDATLGLLGALALLASALVLFRSQRLSGLMTPDDEAVIRALITRFNGNDSLAYFGTRRDKAVVFSPDGMAAITYRVELGVCLAAGDPLGDPRRWPAAIQELLALCNQYGWRPAAYGTSEAGAKVWCATGMSALGIGDETIVDPRTYRINGPQMRPVRQAVTRCRRAGITVRVRRYRELNAAEVAATTARAQDWRGAHDERGFAMALGRLGDPADNDCLLVEALQNADTDNETVVGLLSFTPWGRSGASLDLMRRDRTSINGIVETMVTGLMEQANDFGITAVSLNFVAFRTVLEQGDELGAGPALRGAHGMLTFASRFVQMDSLYRSNAKYLPSWFPRFVCAPDGRGIVTAGLAAVVAEGLLPLPGRASNSARYVGSTSSLPAGLNRDELIATIAATVEPGSQIHRPEQVRVRMAKLHALNDAGMQAYPQACPPSHTIASASAASPGTAVSVAGRVLRQRDHGHLVFADIADDTGTLQVLLELHSGAMSFGKRVDLGDLVQVWGNLGFSRSGEQSVLATSWRMEAKCLHPMPDKWRGLIDQEVIARQRYLELAVDRDATEVLRIRSRAIAAIRAHLGTHDYVEVETPILQQVHGGANAQPFRTHINAYDLDVYLRIAPELYLKRLCVAGMSRIFEIGRNFRNEGVDATHNPEFTSLEAYAAHGDYRTMMTLTRELIIAAAVAAHGRAIAQRPHSDGTFTDVDISGDWPVRTVHQAVSEAVTHQLGRDITISTATSEDELRSLCAELNIDARRDADAGHLITELYEELVEAHTHMPTFFIDFPQSVSPLTRSHDDDPGLAQRWDLVAWGVELGTAYSELTDPIDQRARLTEQSERAAGGDVEAMEIDDDFLTALEYAMPPTGGLGIGIDRVIMLLTGRPIRDTLAFGLTRPR